MCQIQIRKPIKQTTVRELDLRTPPAGSSPTDPARRPITSSRLSHTTASQYSPGRRWPEGKRGHLTGIVDNAALGRAGTASARCAPARSTL
jgi:hypothetical protein